MHKKEQENETIDFNGIDNFQEDVTKLSECVFVCACDGVRVCKIGYWEKKDTFSSDKQQRQYSYRYRHFFC